MNLSLRTILILIITFAFLPLSGQIMAPTGAASVNNELNPADSIYLVNSSQNIILSFEPLNSNSTTNFQWNKYSTETSSWSVSLKNETGIRTELNILEPGGYKVTFTNNDGIEESFRCWIFEPEMMQPTIEISGEDCFSLDLIAKSDSVPLIYYSEDGSLAYTNYHRQYTWTSEPESELPDGELIKFNAPVENTQYFLQVSDKLGNSTTASIEYNAIAVKAVFEHEVMKPDVKHEKHDEAEGSAPIEIRFTDESKGNITGWEWRFGQQGVSGERDPFYVFTVLGEHQVTLRVINQTSEFNCEHTVEDPLTVKVTESEILAPNAFTPNGDGTNDEFRVVYRSIKNYNIQIFNRWGRKVYESSNPAEGWDGTVGKEIADPGVYFYYIEAQGYQPNEKHKLKGVIHLIRDK